MKNEVILYKRKQPFIRLLGLLLAVISFFVIVIFIVECLYYNKKIVIDIFLFPVMLIIFGIYVYLFTGYTKDILISYNEKGFNVCLIHLNKIGILLIRKFYISILFL